MRKRIETIRTVVSKSDEAAETRGEALKQRGYELDTAASMGWTLASTFVIEGIEFATFVDTITYTPPTE
ncbi:hypothetical protein [Curtobacterium sp. PsM8]|uniref:hypothetical protein n=1 Tax=Curtobacterium sp. PsM8 TaxID=3030532 RepID=UPI00263B85F7|nr:hypothetical protein [Curtobacterium sp. PsM8]MDN4649264.1 hypothetical protein [Curtobacterium sp. PsM8]